MPYSQGILLPQLSGREWPRTGNLVKRLKGKESKRKMPWAVLGRGPVWRAWDTTTPFLPPPHPCPAGGKVSHFHWLPVLWVGPQGWGLFPPCPQEHSHRGPWTGASTNLPGRPQLEDGERIQVASCPWTGGSPRDRSYSREKVAGTGQKNLGGSALSAPAYQSSRVKFSLAIRFNN